MPSSTVTASVVIVILIIFWLIFLIIDGIFGLFIFAPYTPPPIEHAFRPTAETSQK